MTTPAYRDPQRLRVVIPAAGYLAIFAVPFYFLFGLFLVSESFATPLVRGVYPGQSSVALGNTGDTLDLYVSPVGVDAACETNESAVREVWSPLPASQAERSSLQQRTVDGVAYQYVGVLEWSDNEVRCEGAGVTGLLITESASDHLTRNFGVLVMVAAPLTGLIAWRVRARRVRAAAVAPAPVASAPVAPAPAQADPRRLVLTWLSWLAGLATVVSVGALVVTMVTSGGASVVAGLENLVVPAAVFVLVRVVLRRLP